MRELFKALSELEANLIEQHGVSLNEAMALCCIGGDRLTASAISEHTGLSASHTSKVIRSIEDKELIVGDEKYVYLFWNKIGKQSTGNEKKG